MKYTNQEQTIHQNSFLAQTSQTTTRPKAVDDTGLQIWSQFLSIVNSDCNNFTYVTLVNNNTRQ